MKIVSILLLYHFVNQNGALNFDNLTSVEGKVLDGFFTFKPIKYVAGLYKTETLFCTGILISAKHVLTVGICLKGFFKHLNTDFSIYYAMLGTQCLYDSYTKYSFEAVRIPKQYNYINEDLPNNIGLISLKITDDAPLITEWIKWSTPDVVMGKTRYLMGWGKGKYPERHIIEKLFYVKVTLISIDGECSRVPFRKNYEQETMFCSKLNKRMENCRVVYKMEEHDLGAPLVNANGELLGLLCFLVLSRRRKMFGIYTNIYKYNDWISNAIVKVDHRPNIEKQYITATPEGIFDTDFYNGLYNMYHRNISSGCDEHVKQESVKLGPENQEGVRQERSKHESVNPEPAKPKAVELESENQKSVRHKRSKQE